MDPFDEFEFKPLTNGLGFHKKSGSLKESTEKAALIEAELNKFIPEAPPSGLMEEHAPARTSPSASYEDILKALEKPVFSSENTKNKASDVKFTQPLPRPGSQSIKSMEIDKVPTYPVSTPPPAFPKASINPRLPNKNFIETQNTGVRRGAADSPMGGLVKAPVSLSSAILDFVVVTALSMVFLVSLLLVTEVSLISVQKNSLVDMTTQLSLALLFIAVMQMYVVISRSFFGRTLGEWTFDYQMGNSRQHSSPYYPLLVAWRSLVITVTGIVLLPVLSFIVRRDLAALLTGLQLYRERI